MKAPVHIAASLCLLSAAAAAQGTRTVETPLDSPWPFPTSAVGLRFSWLDDGIAGLQIPAGNHLAPIVIDDNGFTNGFALEGLLGDEHEWVVGSLRLVNLTERPASGRPADGLRRWDFLDASAGFSTRRTTSWGAWTVTPSLGLALGGDFGGLWLQSTFHELTGYSARTAGHGLQTNYPSDTRVGVTFGATAELEAQVQRWVFVRGRATLQGALGRAGLSTASAQASVGATRSWPTRFGPVRPSLWLSLEAATTVAREEVALMPGGYAREPYLMPGVTVGVDVGVVSLGWQVVLNAGGAGYPNGAFVVEYGRLGRTL